MTPESLRPGAETGTLLSDSGIGEPRGEKGGQGGHTGVTYTTVIQGCHTRKGASHRGVT